MIPRCHLCQTPIDEDGVRVPTTYGVRWFCDTCFEEWRMAREMFMERYSDKDQEDYYD